MSSRSLAVSLRVRPAGADAAVPPVALVLTPAPRPLDALPDDVLRHVAAHLPSYGLRKLGGLNRQWAALCADRALPGNRTYTAVPVPPGAWTAAEAGRYHGNPYCFVNAEAVARLMRPATWAGSLTRAAELAADGVAAASLLASCALPVVALAIGLQRVSLSTPMPAVELALWACPLPLLPASHALTLAAEALYRRRCAALGVAPRG